MLCFLASSWMRMLIRRDSCSSGCDAKDDVLGFLGGESRAHEILGDDALERGWGIDAHVDQAPRDRGIEAQGLDDRSHGVPARVAALRLDLLDVDAPADQARGKPRV